MQSAPTFVHPRVRRDWSLDFDGVPFKVKEFDTTLAETWDLAEVLPSGTTVTAASWTSTGPTISGAAVSGTTYSATVTGAGDALVTLTLSSGGPLVFRWRWKALDRSVGDYSS